MIFQNFKQTSSLYKEKEVNAKEKERERKNLKITVLTQKEATKGSAVHIW